MIKLKPEKNVLLGFIKNLYLEIINLKRFFLPSLKLSFGSSIIRALQLLQHFQLPEPALPYR
ncbi:MAG: hypothetical protein ACLFO6_07850, partial [Archaeoglobaceae archaeon]